MKTKFILAILALSLSIFGLIGCDEENGNSLPTNIDKVESSSSVENVLVNNYQLAGDIHGEQYAIFMTNGKERVEKYYPAPTYEFNVDAYMEDYHQFCIDYNINPEFFAETVKVSLADYGKIIELQDHDKFYNDLLSKLKNEVQTSQYISETDREWSLKTIELVNNFFNVSTCEEFYEYGVKFESFEQELLANTTSEDALSRSGIAILRNSYSIQATDNSVNAFKSGNQVSKASCTACQCPACDAKRLQEEKSRITGVLGTIADYTAGSGTLLTIAASTAGVGLIPGAIMVGGAAAGATGTFKEVMSWFGW